MTMFLRLDVAQRELQSLGVVPQWMTWPSTAKELRCSLQPHVCKRVCFGQQTTVSRPSPCGLLAFQRRELRNRFVRPLVRRPAEFAHPLVRLPADVGSAATGAGQPQAPGFKEMCSHEQHPCTSNSQPSHQPPRPTACEPSGRPDTTMMHRIRIDCRQNPHCAGDGCLECRWVFSVEGSNPRSPLC